MWDITIHPPWESDALVGTLAPHGRVALIPLSHPRTRSAVTRYCPLWARRPSRFCFRQFRSSFPIGHPSWDCSSIIMLNLGVPIPSEAAEPPKGLALDWSGFGGVGYLEVKHVDARAISGWVTYWEAAPKLPETKPGFGGVGYSEVKHVDARAIPGWVTYWEAAPELPETKP
ncbi:hypothetical protein ACLB2K_004669 [Fragaria x ananassa]